MQHEQVPTTNNERLSELRSVLFGPEIAHLEPAYLAMFSAENDACFAAFVDGLDDETEDIATQAASGDPDAIAHITELYRAYRESFESALAAYDGDTYNTFIEAVAEGNVQLASTIALDFLKAQQPENGAIIDDELDAQFI